MKMLACVLFILCLGLSGVAMARGGGGGAGGGGAGAGSGGGAGTGGGGGTAGVSGVPGIGGGNAGNAGEVGNAEAAGGVSGAGRYGGDVGDIGGQRLEQRGAYHRYHRQTRNLADTNRHERTTFKKNVAYDMVKTDHYHFRDTVGAEMTSHHRASPEAFIKQMPRNNGYTLSPGLPMLGLDPRSPSTWALYSEMLPPIFSEPSAPASDGISEPRLGRGEAGM